MLSLLPYDVTKSKWVKLKLSKMYSMTDLAIHRLKFVWQSIHICIVALHSVIIIIITHVGNYWTLDLMHRLVVSAFYQKVGQFLFGRWIAISWRFATILYYFSLYVFAAALIRHCTSYPTPTHYYYIGKWSYLSNISVHQTVDIDQMQLCEYKQSWNLNQETKKFMLFKDNMYIWYASCKIAETLEWWISMSLYSRATFILVNVDLWFSSRVPTF